jgi:hypothetical protein
MSQLKNCVLQKMENQFIQNNPEAIHIIGKKSLQIYVSGNVCNGIIEQYHYLINIIIHQITSDFIECQILDTTGGGHEETVTITLDEIPTFLQKYNIDKYNCWNFTNTRNLYYILC